MRDLLPPESRARRRVSEQLQGVFERYGYELVTTPLFERVEVFERGLTLDPRDLLRFVEPESGEVAALRPDITPQIARVVSTRLSDYPPPWRIRYEGTVIRRRRGRARRQRQIAQVGVELIGLSGPEADVEVIRLMSEAAHAAGLERFRIELSEVGVGRTLLAEHGDGLLDVAADALAQKDEARLLDILARASVPQRERERIAALAHLHGDIDVLREAKKLLKSSAAAAAHLESLEHTIERLIAAGLGPQLGVDLGEIRGAAYYTGVSFALFAAGPGEAVASGGRYDQLLARYGTAQPATGAGIDVENLLWALDHAGQPWRERSGTRIALAGPDAGRVRKLADALHARGVVAATLPGASERDALNWARGWGYDALVHVTERAASASRVRDEGKHKLGGDLSSADIEAFLSWAGASQKE